MIFQGHADRNIIWFRIFEWGLVLNGGRMYFSERNGYMQKPLLKIGRWRLRILKPNDWRS